MSWLTHTIEYSHCCLKSYHLNYSSIRSIYGQLMDPESSVIAFNGRDDPKADKVMNGVTNELKNSAKSYAETLKKLMEFENNTSVLQRINSSDHVGPKNKLKLLTKLLKMINIELMDLNRLNFIHISGTKGKGSTCAYVESILRERGYKTGLYTSPHLVSVRDRIRISGKSISIESFVDYFWSVQSKIDGHSEQPGFFMFLTLLSLNIFLSEKVDVAILETGIGGEYDCTNIITAPIVTGITSLGIDHTTILGDSLESIAWHKAGIIKPGVPCFSAPQPESAQKVILDRSKEKGSSLFHCPPMNEYQKLTPAQINLGIDGQAQKTNASLALQLSRYWHNSYKHKFTPSRDDHQASSGLASGFLLDKEEICGLEKTSWPGRCQLITRRQVKYFLDGAHTVESLHNCLEWFNRKSNEIGCSDGLVIRVLCFYTAGLRQYEPLIRRAANEPFDLALFPANFVDNHANYPELILDSRHSLSGITDRINKTKSLWQSIQRQNHRNPENCKQFTSLSQTLNYLESPESFELIRKLTNSIGGDITGKYSLHVLVTGSLVFVGNVLTLIDCEPRSK